MARPERKRISLFCSCGGPASPIQLFIGISFLCSAGSYGLIKSATHVDFVSLQDCKHISCLSWIRRRATHGTFFPEGKVGLYV